MTSATLSSEEFDQDPERAKTLTAQGPVVVTEAGKPAYALLGVEDYRRLAPKRRTMLEAMTGPVLLDTDLDLPRFNDLPHPADLD